ncbi:hypothetical protein Rhal01_02579 [Rubritalea halochordaticola]|uniref:CAAX prenyl protease 2/Lysostaphin resistance protein A-like domain-containing protein n=1 Tax=Rubritalea halochordaticola TaxID=714537 RepID=A0ABP9V121_9BACT
MKNHLSPSPRVSPSVGAAMGVFIAYVLLVNGIQYVSGIPYTEFFATAGNAWKSANASLAAGCVLLLAFAFWSRWDGIWRDDKPHRMTGVMWIAPVVFVLVMLSRLVFKLSAGVEMSLLLAIIVAGVGVGIAEELLFRGIILRALRNKGRSEAWAMLWCSVWFGLMHATNVFVGSPPLLVAGQCVLATLSGMTLYLFRRSRGWLLTGMIAHGIWDISTFLPAAEHNSTAQTAEMAFFFLTPLVGLISGIAAFRYDHKRANNA